MATYAGATAVEGFDQVDTSQRFPLGHTIDLGNRAYVYVQGVASGAVNKAVTYTKAGVTTLLVSNAKGPVGWMQSTLDATTKYGFICVKALNGDLNADCATTVAADTVPYSTATGGRIDDAAAIGDKIYNAFITSAGASNVLTVWCAHPYVTDESN